jgi:hypothetical protein
MQQGRVLRCVEDVQVRKKERLAGQIQVLQKLKLLDTAFSRSRRDQQNNLIISNRLESLQQNDTNEVICYHVCEDLPFNTDDSQMIHNRASVATRGEIVLPSDWLATACLLSPAGRRQQSPLPPPPLARGRVAG